MNPFTGFRVGAALQTRTRTTVNERWGDEGQTDFSGPDGKRWESESPYGENSWTFTSPLKANFGIAYTLGQFGTASVDYELSNYGNLKYRSSAYTDRKYLEEINEDMKASYGISHNLRAGVEVKPVPALALRAGYGLKTSAQKAVWDNNIEDYVGVKPVFTHNAALGIGFSSKGSFFADAAVTRTFLPDEYFMPYNDYVFVSDGNDGYVVDHNYYAPDLQIRSALWKVILTLGFRF